MTLYEIYKKNILRNNLNHEIKLNLSKEIKTKIITYIFNLSVISPTNFLFLFLNNSKLNINNIKKEMKKNKNVMIILNIENKT